MTDDALFDRLAIREVVERTLFATDVRDAELWVSAFTEDGVMTSTIPGLEPRRGREELLARSFASLASVGPSSHGLGKISVRVDGDTAHATTFAVAHIHAGNVVLVRGIRYDDDLVRTEAGWRIRQRRHDPHWQGDVPAVRPHLP